MKMWTHLESERPEISYGVQTIMKMRWGIIMWTKQLVAAGILNKEPRGEALTGMPIANCEHEVRVKIVLIVPTLTQ